MSDAKRYTPSMRVGQMVKDSDGLWIRSQDYDATLSQLAALREELAKADNTIRIRCEQNEEMGKLIESQQQRLADAERRNAAMEGALERVTFRMKSFIDAGRDMPLESATVTCDIALRALNPNPEAASHDE